MTFFLDNIYYFLLNFKLNLSGMKIYMFLNSIH